MSWHSIDVVDDALNKTKKVLIEPFSFWKWIKLGIIVFLMGGSSSSPSNFNPWGFNGRDVEAPPPVEDISGGITQFLNQYLMIILLIIGLFLLIILVLAYISNIMEFVFVHSLVTNQVRFWEYSRTYLRLGFNLFIIRILLTVAFILLLAIFILPMLLPLLGSLENIGPGMIFSIIIWVLLVVVVLAVIFGIIGSFINLAIPLAMYHKLGIIAAFRRIAARFRADWKQIVVYWIVRFVLGIAVAIIIGIAGLILLLMLFGSAAITGVLLYFGLSAVGIGLSDLLFWVVFAPFFLVWLILFAVFILFIIVPGRVFLKFHMLTFLKAWCPEAAIPFFNSKMMSRSDSIPI